MQPKTLTVCLAQEPRTLHAVSIPTPAERAVLEALYDGFVDSRDYGYQPVAVEKLPSFDGGDAVRRQVTAHAGDAVYDAGTDTVFTLPVNQVITLEQADGSRAQFPAGAEEVSGVQVEVTWTLKSGLTWQDGVPVTAHDFAFAWAVARAPGAPSLTPRDATAAFGAPDERTLHWRGLPGYMRETYFIPPVSIAMPAHAFAGENAAQALADPRAQRAPLAYGPFKLDEWVAGDHITLSRNPYYWRAAEGLPKLDTLTLRFVPGAADLLGALASGACDVGTHESDFAALLPQLGAAAAAGEVVTQSVPAPEIEHLDFNAQPLQGYTGFAAAARNADGSPVFASPAVRQAIAYCLDRPVLVAQASGGSALPAAGYVPAGHPLYAPDAGLAEYPFDPQKGQALLRSAGWADTDGDGVLDRDGRKFSFYWSTRTTPLRERLVQLASQQLKTNCGIEALPSMHGMEFLFDGPDGMVFGRQYDAAEFSWSIGPKPLCSRYTSDKIPSDAHDWRVPNAAGFADPAFDAACAAGQYANAQREWSFQLPALPLLEPLLFTVTRPGVQGVRLDPTAASDLWNVELFDAP